MNNYFSQLKVIYKIQFNTKYKNIELFEAFFTENQNIVGTSSYEVESTTIDSRPDDVWCLEVYLINKPNLRAFRNALSNYCKHHHLENVTDLAFGIIEDQDWVAEYQKQQSPIEVGRFCLGSRANLDNHYLGTGIPIYLEASRAFGTGQHETTSGCIEAMEYLADHSSLSGEYERIFDIGTGSGVLSFVAEKLWPNAWVTGCDIDPISIEIAITNQAFNQSDVTFYLNDDKASSLARDGGKYDLIISNILAAPLISLASAINDICNNNACVILSGFLEYQLSEVLTAYMQNGFIQQKIMNKNGWIIATLRLKNS